MLSDIPATSGIYRITCTVTGKFYIGSTTNLRKRQCCHFSLLRQNKHSNPHLQHAWNKHTEQTFTFEVLELVLPMSLTAREQYWLNKLNPFGKKGFNIARNAQANRLGAEVSPATREKLRIAQSGKKQSEEARRKKTEAGKRRTHSMKTREKMGLAQRNRLPASTETREKIRLARLGTKSSEEAKRKMSNYRTGRELISIRKTLIVTAPDGTEYTITGVQSFCKEHHLAQSSLMAVARGVQNQHRGWTARYP